MTSSDIETLIYDKLKAALGTLLIIGGGVYKSETRPFIDNPDNNAEDCVITIINGTGEEVTKGNCLVNVYTQDVLGGSGQWYPNKERNTEVEHMLERLPQYLRTDSDVYFEKSELIRTIAEEGTREHFVSLKMTFKVLNNV